MSLRTAHFNNHRRHDQTTLFALQKSIEMHKPGNVESCHYRYYVSGFGTYHQTQLNFNSMYIFTSFITRVIQQVLTVNG